MTLDLDDSPVMDGDLERAEFQGSGFGLKEIEPLGAGIGRGSRRRDRHGEAELGRLRWAGSGMRVGRGTGRSGVIYS